jgi:hypothetical protein
MRLLLVFALLLAIMNPAANAAAVHPAHAAVRMVPGMLVAQATPEPEVTLSPSQILGLIRYTFRTHRPPPPFEDYKLSRYEKDDHGFPDYPEIYTYHIYVRNLDRAALGRKIFRDHYDGDPEFMRPAFNEDRDPGPPTADLFEPAPKKPHPIEFVPTPEPSQTPLREIGLVFAAGEFDYRVVSIKTEGKELHVIIEPTRDPDRNRLRELFVDKDTYELHKLIATDKLFLEGDGPTVVYAVLFTVKLGTVEGYPVVTSIHGIVGANLSNPNDTYSGDGAIVDYKFFDISFPKTLPDWYFRKNLYNSHRGEWPPETGPVPSPGPVAI